MAAVTTTVGKTRGARLGSGKLAARKVKESAKETPQGPSEESSARKKRRTSGAESAAVVGEAPEPTESTSEDPEAADPLESDPYLLKDRDYHECHPSTRWTNKQRCYVLCSRGVNAMQRHLMEDWKAMLPHAKGDAKWERSSPLADLTEAAELANCNNIVYFESRRGDQLYMWMAKVPSGPSVKFQVHNVHTLGSINLTGNCLRHSRPMLVFDRAFETRDELKIMREMFLQMLGIPRHHPKSKPFHDHVLSFFYLDGKVWCRHYQIFSPKFSDKISEQSLREIGPRFVLEPIRIFEQPFGGKSLWKSPDYESPKVIYDRMSARARQERHEYTQDCVRKSVQKRAKPKKFVDHKNFLISLRETTAR